MHVLGLLSNLLMYSLPPLPTPVTRMRHFLNGLHKSRVCSEHPTYISTQGYNADKEQLQSELNLKAPYRERAIPNWIPAPQTLLFNFANSGHLSSLNIQTFSS